MQTRRNFRYRRSKVGNDREDMLSEINATVQQLTSDNNNLQITTSLIVPTVYIYEFHAGSNPSFGWLAGEDGNGSSSLLDAWKIQAQRHNITLLTFAIVREPTEWMLSAYLMICIEQNICSGVRGSPDSRKQPTPSLQADSLTDLESAVLPNPQCKFLLRAGFPYHFKYDVQYQPTSQECLIDLWNLLKEKMDWIGTTETYQSSVMDWLKHITGFQNLATYKSKIGNTTRKMSLSQLATNKSIHIRLQQRNAYDIELYNRVTEHYKTEYWKGIK